MLTKGLTLGFIQGCFAALKRCAVCTTNENIFLVGLLTEQPMCCFLHYFISIGDNTWCLF